jgi:hypothetical protein
VKKLGIVFIALGFSLPLPVAAHTFTINNTTDTTMSVTLDMAWRPNITKTVAPKQVLNIDTVGWCTRSVSAQGIPNPDGTEGLAVGLSASHDYSGHFGCCCSRTIFINHTYTSDSGTTVIVNGQEADKPGTGELSINSVET